MLQAKLLEDIFVWLTTFLSCEKTKECWHLKFVHGNGCRVTVGNIANLSIFTKTLD